MTKTNKTIQSGTEKDFTTKTDSKMEEIKEEIDKVFYFTKTSFRLLTRDSDGNILESRIAKKEDLVNFILSLLEENI